MDGTIEKVNKTVYKSILVNYIVYRSDMIQWLGRRCETNKCDTKQTSSEGLEKCTRIHIQNLLFWVDSVHAEGLEKVRTNAGYHDEPLKGERKGQRSIRLNQSYRAFYREEDGEIQLVEVIEVNKHKY